MFVADRHSRRGVEATVVNLRIKLEPYWYLQHRRHDLELIGFVANFVTRRDSYGVQ